MTYMENAHKGIRIEQLIDGKWHFVEDDLPASALFLIAGKKDYRAVNLDGNVVKNPFLDGDYNHDH